MKGNTHALRPTHTRGGWVTRGSVVKLQPTKERSRLPVRTGEERPTWFRLLITPRQPLWVWHECWIALHISASQWATIHTRLSEGALGGTEA